jgi:hypothetical protein
MNRYVMVLALVTTPSSVLAQTWAGQPTYHSCSYPTAPWYTPSFLGPYTSTPGYPHNCGFIPVFRYRDQPIAAIRYRPVQPAPYRYRPLPHRIIDYASPEAIRRLY